MYAGYFPGVYGAPQHLRPPHTRARLATASPTPCGHTPRPHSASADDTDSFLPPLLEKQLVFTIIIVASTVFLWESEKALRYADSVGFVNISNWELAAANELKGGIERTWEACGATVVAAATAGDYILTCSNSDLGAVEDAVNARCLQEDNVDPASDYKECFTSDSWWPMPDGVDPNDVEAVLNTDKGIFCACYSEFQQNVETYFMVGKWVSLGSCIFFGFVFFACCYICCCSKTAQQKQIAEQQAQQKEQKKAEQAGQAYLARP